MFATVGFGMGLDCPDVREVIHLGSPDDMRQETGRGGGEGMENPLWHSFVCTSLGSFMYCSVSKINTSCCQDAFNYVQLETKCMCCDICASVVLVDYVVKVLLLIIDFFPYFSHINF